MKLKPWKLVDKEDIVKGAIFKYEKHHYQSTTSEKGGHFDHLKFADWVNVIALTPTNDIVLVRQFRAGTNSMTLEIPGGGINPGEHSDPLEAGKRELEEETGYLSNDWVSLGSVAPNPAFQGNTCYTFLAKNCTPTGQQNFDPMEEVEVVTTPFDNIKQMIKDGEINHSLIIAAFHLYSIQSNL